DYGIYAQYSNLLKLWKHSYLPYILTNIILLFVRVTAGISYNHGNTLKITAYLSRLVSRNEQLIYLIDSILRYRVTIITSETLTNQSKAIKTTSQNYAI